VSESKKGVNVGAEQKSGYDSNYPQWCYGNARDCQYINPFMEIMLRVLKKASHVLHSELHKFSLFICNNGYF
jgi:hypothetical protein